MNGDRHGGTDQFFKKLVDQAAIEDTKLLLKGLHRLCVLTEENGFGMQEHAEANCHALTAISDKLDRLAGQIVDALQERR